MDQIEQVGGTHYQSKYQHWDWCADTAIGYLEGNATKYLARWRKKGGKQDLEKALSYVKKVLAGDGILPAGERLLKSPDRRRAFLEANDLQGTAEAVIIKNIDEWMDRRDLENIITDIQELLNETRG